MNPSEIDIEQIYKDALEDPTLLSTINIDALLKKIGDNHYLEGKTVEKLSEEIFDAIFSLEHMEETVAKDICHRLIGYRVVDRICDLRNGRLMRWLKPFRISAPSGENSDIWNENWFKKGGGKLTNGGLLMNVKIENTGVQLLCKNNAGRFFNVRFDDCIVFQKLTMEEQIVLMANAL